MNTFIYIYMYSYICKRKHKNAQAIVDNTLEAVFNDSLRICIIIYIYLYTYIRTGNSRQDAGGGDK